MVQLPDSTEMAPRPSAGIGATLPSRTSLRQPSRRAPARAGNAGFLPQALPEAGASRPPAACWVAPPPPAPPQPHSSRPAGLLAAAAPANFRAELLLEHASLMHAAFAPGSHNKINTAMRNYFKYCELLGYQPHAQAGGITPHELELYITWMARTLAPGTISGYLSSGLRHLVEATGQPWRPPSALYSTNLLLRGVKRTLGMQQPNRKHAVTLRLLRTIHTQIDPIGQPNDQTFWAVCLFLFFTFLRKAHVMLKGGQPTAQTILRDDIRLTTGEKKFLLTVRHTKTVQFRQRTLRWLLPKLTDATDPCCPTTQLAVYLQRTRRAVPALAATQPLFQTLRPDGTHEPLRYDHFIAWFKAQVAQAGLDPTMYAGHSFRRGGATFAMDAGLRDTTIMAMGDWKSDAWQSYVAATQRLRFSAADLLEKAMASASAEPPLYNNLDDDNGSEALPR